eukprot:m.207420 g.207420  ORF g.207420 m.207420 type:complete len:94 (+) comp13762_c0_seq17:1510-1791(+)
MAETSSISRDNVNIAITPQPSIKTLFFLQHRNNRKLSIAVFDWRMGFPTPHTGNETARSHSTARNRPTVSTIQIRARDTVEANDEDYASWRWV